MLTPRHDPFPFEAVRDLLGILRAMYAATVPEWKRRRAKIEALANELRKAVDLALEYEPGTMGHAAAWQRAERVVTQLPDLVDVTTPAAPVLKAAARRIRRRA